MERQLTAIYPNTIVLGRRGSGKTKALKMMLESISCAVVIDPKRELVCSAKDGAVVVDLDKWSDDERQKIQTHTSGQIFLVGGEVLNVIEAGELAVRCCRADKVRFVFDEFSDDLAPLLNVATAARCAIIVAMHDFDFMAAYKRNEPWFCSLTNRADWPEWLLLSAGSVESAHFVAEFVDNLNVNFLMHFPEGAGYYIERGKAPQMINLGR